MVTMPQLEVYFATNREHRTKKGQPFFGERFHQDGSHVFRVGRALVDRDGDTYTASMAGVTVYQEALAKQDPRVDELFGDPDLPPEVALREAQRRVTEDPRRTPTLGSRTVFAELRRRMAEDQCDVILFVHGYASTFQSALERAAQLKYEYLIGEQQALMFCFSWPSNGRLFPPTEYHDDRDDAAQSGEAMARALLKLMRFLREHPERCERKIHLVAHSMGNWALRSAVQRIAEHFGRHSLPQIFEHVFLMAADADSDALEAAEKLQPLQSLARAIHVYHSVDDAALRVSDWTKSNPNRLGTSGPKRMQRLADSVVAVDCQFVDDTQLSHGNHQYYRLRREVIDDVRGVLQGAPPDAIPNRKGMGANRFRIRQPEAERERWDPA